jgi:TolB-like protein
VTTEAIRLELARVLSSSEFTSSRHLTNFLTYIVEEALAGREERLKERTIAIGALGRDADFDSRLDCIVRVVAGKLRRALQRYYATGGAANSVCIAVPAGSYVPVFRRALAPSSPGRSGSPEPCTRQRRDGLGRPVVVVVPFLSFTTGSAERLAADLLAEDVAVCLSRFTWLEVVDCLTTRPPGVDRDDPCTIAAQLHADFVLTGTAGRTGSRVRLSAQLIDARSGALAWAERFEQSLCDERFAQHDELVERIVTSVGDLYGPLNAAVWSRAPNGNGVWSGYQAVLAGFQYQCRLDRGPFHKVLRGVERAVMENPDFAWGWAALAALHLFLMSSVGGDEASNQSEQALAHIKRALILDPNFAFAHVTMGLHRLFCEQSAVAAECAERALDLARGAPFEVGAAGALLSLAGDHNRGRKLTVQALHGNPRLPGWIHWGTALGAIAEQDAAEALSATERFTLPDCFVDPLIRAVALAASGDVHAARRAVEQSDRLVPDLARRVRTLFERLVPRLDVRERIFDDLREAGLRVAIAREHVRPRAATSVVR